MATGSSCTRSAVPAGTQSRRSFVRSGRRAGRWRSRPTRALDRSKDWLGSVRAVTDKNGTTISSFDYDPWGNLLSSSFDAVPGGFPYRFGGSLGVRFDSATGLYYMRNRWHDPQTGRFISQDSISRSNGYIYGAGNPVRYADPRGLDATDINDILNYSPTDALLSAQDQNAMDILSQVSNTQSSPPASIGSDTPATVLELAGPVGPGDASNSPPITPTSGIHYEERPKNAIHYQIPGGKDFWAPPPPKEDFTQIYQAGRSVRGDWPWNWKSDAQHALGHFGTYDVQRDGVPSNFKYYKAYQDASNYNVGIWMNGAGYPKNITLDIAHHYQQSEHTSNAGSKRDDYFTKCGWDAAQSGNYAKRITP